MDLDHATEEQERTTIMVVMDEEKDDIMRSHRWLFDGHNIRSRSPWLKSTLAELDQKTKAMLKLIEEDADSFAQRAEMYYKKRPELISLVGDFYKAHRSLAEKYALLKLDSGSRRLSLESPLSSLKYQPDDSTSENDQPIHISQLYPGDDESEVEDPQHEDDTQVGEETKEKEDFSEVGNDEVMNLKEVRKMPEEDNVKINDKLIQREDEFEIDKNEILNLKEEVERLRAENRMRNDQLSEKDEEKREVIRQLSLSLEMVKEENLELRECISNDTLRKRNFFDLSKLKGFFLGKCIGSSS